MDILHQLGDLFLQAVPTVVIVFLFICFMRGAFFGPITKAMDERRARIEGARAEAAKAEAEAKQDAEAYHEALKKARAEIYGEQEAARQVVLDERTRLLKAMRARAQEDVETAKKRIHGELEAARTEVERQTPALASEITKMILENPAPPRGGARA
jgi:F-type H+-transporting ATPase subunit b